MTQRFFVLLVLLILRYFVPSFVRDKSSFTQVNCVYYSYYNSNQGLYTILLKSQYYNTPAATRFGPHWPIIRKHTIVKTVA
jgi:hypothetical protein